MGVRASTPPPGPGPGPSWRGKGPASPAAAFPGNFLTVDSCRINLVGHFLENLQCLISCLEIMSQYSGVKMWER